MQDLTTAVTVAAALAVFACDLFADGTGQAEDAHSSHGCPLHTEHQGYPGGAADDHHAAVDARGDLVMGFEHTRTVHHFRLSADGGAIEVEVTDDTDTESRESIRRHLAEVARAFSAGDFSMPRAIHDREPPGVPAMIDHRSRIDYRFEEIPGGARVVIRTSVPEALEAVHAFLRFQIEDHATDDPLTVDAGQ